MSERERFAIEAFYYSNVTGELEKAAETYELWQQTYPRNYVPYGNLGVISFILGNYEKSLTEYREALSLEPNDVSHYSNLGSTYMSLNRLEDAEAVYRRADDRKLENECLLASRYMLAFLNGDPAQMERFALAATGEARHGRRIAGPAGGHSSLVWENEECAGADATGNEFRRAQRCQRNSCVVSG